MKLRDINILDAWIALGGGPLRGKRGKAFWRGGDGSSVSLDLEQSTWYDFVAGIGGGPLKLAEIALGCSRPAALKWLESNLGLDPLQPLSIAERRKHWDHRQERDNAKHFGVTAEALAEQVLEHLNSSDLRRTIYTRLLDTFRTGGPLLVEEYRTWLDAYPKLTGAMVRAGASSQARVQRRLAFYLQDVANAA